jgi:hypothetical protein
VQAVPQKTTLSELGVEHMVDDAQRNAALDSIRQNIADHGHHIYVVSGGADPRYAYTIGVSESIGAELILAGAIFYMKDEVVEIISDIAAQLKAEHDQKLFEVVGLGSFTLRKADTSWVTALMLGALDFYQVREIPAFQIVPDEAHWTIDVPNMSAAWSAATAPIWQWLHEPWTYPVPEESMTATNLSALRGERITEAARWEEDEWELFAGAGPDIPKEETRVVALGTLLAVDNSLIPVANLPIGEGLWRDPHPGSEWHAWRKRDDPTGS